MNAENEQLSTESVAQSSAATIVDNSNRTASATRQSGSDHVDESPVERLPDKVVVVIVWTPVAVAAILDQCNDLVITAIAAYRSRNHLDEQACTRMVFFAPETSVITQVSMARCLLVLLSNTPLPARLLLGWPTEVNYLSANGNSLTANSLSYRLGVILASGFEILVTRAKPTPGLVTTVTPIEAVSQDGHWPKFISALQKRKYFQNCCEGDEAYEDLMEKAHGFFIAALSNESGCIELGLLIHEMVLYLQPRRHLWQLNRKLQDDIQSDHYDREQICDENDLPLMLSAAEQMLKKHEHSCITQICDKIYTFLSLFHQGSGNSDPAAAKRKISRRISAPLRKLSQMSNVSGASGMSSLLCYDGSQLCGTNGDISACFMEIGEECDDYWKEERIGSRLSNYNDDIDLCDLQFALNEARNN